MKPGIPELVTAAAQEQHWWTDVALDGIVGAVLGGVVTWAAVALTIRHERSSAAHAELRAAVARLRGNALRAQYHLAGDEEDVDTSVWGDQLWDVVTASMEVQALAFRLAPELAKDVESFDNDIMEGEDGVDAERDRLVQLIAVLLKWARNPRRYKSSGPIKATVVDEGLDAPQENEPSSSST